MLGKRQGATARRDESVVLTARAQSVMFLAFVSGPFTCRQPPGDLSPVAPKDLSLSLSLSSRASASAVFYLRHG